MRWNERPGAGGTSAQVGRNTHLKLGSLAEARRTFDVIMVVGHSNDEGIRIASDRFESWRTFAAYLKPFAPRRLLMIACEAGKWRAADTFFTKLPKLRRIYASPVKVSREAGNVLIAILPLLVVVKAPKPHYVAAAQWAFIAQCGAQFREWLRDRDKGNPDGRALDLLSQLVDPIVRDVPFLVRSVVKRIVG